MTTVNSITKPNQSSRAFKQLRQAIIDGVFRPNQRLIESELAHKLKMSRTPVREAIRELLITGYIVRLPNGGVAVAELSIKQIRNLSEVREALETMAITLACQRASAKDIEMARKTQLLLVDAVSKRDIDQSIAVNADFHDQLLGGCGNEQLLTLLGMIRDQYIDRRVLLLFTANNWKSTIRQHERMLEAVRCHNATLARKAVRDHLGTLNKVTLQRL